MSAEILPAAGAPGAAEDGAGEPGDRGGSASQVGAYRQGSEASRAVVSRYLVGTALAQSVNRGMWSGGVLTMVLAALLWIAHWRVLAVLVALVAAGVLILRLALRALLDHLLMARMDDATRATLRTLVADTRRDVLRELRRIGLPGRDLTLPLLGVRLVRGRRRQQTLARLREFDLDRVVPASRVDELHLALRAANIR